MNRIKSIIEKLPALSLKDVNRVGLMNRVDTKFYFHERLLPNILMSILGEYSVLEIKGQRIMPYQSFYYDTPNRQMLKWHHNGKLNRYKIRQRKYLLTGETFLEIKFKSNKGKTEKYRRINGVDLGADRDFIAEKTPFCWLELDHVMNNQFDRIMLVNHNMKERVSIDLNVGFSNGNDKYSFLDRLVILEIKSERHVGTTELQRSLKYLHIHPNSFSKFVTGMYLHHKALKYNRFKRRFLDINKVLEKNIL